MPRLPRPAQVRVVPFLASLALACLVIAASRLADRTVSAAAAETRIAPSSAQASTEPQFTIQTRVPLTIVDVTVTDAKGQPIHGLKESDFTVLEDNQEMKPNSFEEHSSDETVSTSTPSEHNLPPDTFTNSAQRPPDARPLFILLLDELNTPAQMQQQVTQRMIDFVNKMKPGTQMAVFRLTTHLSILQGFTSDRDLLKAALTSKNSIAWPSPVGDDTGGDTETEGNHSAFQGQSTIAAMRQIARYVSGIPGRKNLVWLSGSFPLQFPPVTDPIAFPGSASQGSVYDLTGEVKSATDLMARAHLVLYPVDWRGPSQLAICPKCISGLSNQGNMLFAERGTMQDIADQTGGKFFFNTNDYAGAVEQAIDNSSNYYTLTYVPANQALDTRFRTIKVTVDRPGLHLDYRNGYYATQPTVDARGKKIETVSPMQSAMMRGALNATQILFKVKATEAPATEVSLPIHNLPNPKQMKPPYRHISVTYTIDIANIQFTPAPDGNYHAAFEYGIRVYNADGDEIVNSASKEAHPILSPAVYQSMLKTGAVSHDEIDVPARGDYFLRIAVHDLTSNRVGALEIPASSIHPDPVPAVASGPNP